MINDFNINHYLQHLVDTYQFIERIHFFWGQDRDVPLLVLELDSEQDPEDHFKPETWMCENFIDLYLFRPGKGWLSSCKHLLEELILIPKRIKHLKHSLAYEKEFGLFPLSITGKSPFALYLENPEGVFPGNFPSPTPP